MVRAYHHGRPPGNLRGFARRAPRFAATVWSMAPAIVAHRGYRQRFPENTLSGIAAAVACGARFIEVDVQLTRDGVPVLFHDDTLERVCGVSGRVGERPFSELCQLSAFEPGRLGMAHRGTPLARLADLDDWLARHPEVTAFVEVKDTSVAQFGPDAVFERVQSALSRSRSQCIAISFSEAYLQRARRDVPIGAVAEGWSEALALLGRLHPQFLFCDHACLPSAGSLSLPGTRLVVYEITDPLVAVALLDRGVALIETFAACDMIAALKA